MRIPAAACVTTDAWPVRCDDFGARSEYRFRRHSHAQPHICLILEGSLYERVGRGQRCLVPGSGRVSPAGDAHDLAVGPGGVRCLVLSVAAECLADSGVPAPDDRRFIEGRGVTNLAHRIRSELAVVDEVSPIALEILALEAAALTLRHRPSEEVRAAPRWLERVRCRLHDEMRAPPTLQALAADAGVSRAHLARCFRSSYGSTIGQYVRRLRLDTARFLLLRSELPLAEVASRAGFADQSHMTRLVGSRFGVTPAAVRRSG